MWVDIEKKEQEFSHNVLQLLLLYRQNTEVARELKMKTLFLFQVTIDFFFLTHESGIFIQVLLGFLDEYL